MKTVFMGTPELAATVLRYLAESGHEVGYAVSQPDKAKNRGKKMQPTTVKEEAERLGIPVLQPEKIRDNEEFLETLREYNPDLIVVAAYGKILPKSILDLPRLGCVNVHGSLLPKYRGAAPVQRSIIDGEEITGVTLMYMAEGMDTGDMLAKVETTTAGKTSDVLMNEIAELGGKLLVDKLPELEAGTLERIPQDDALATYAPMIFKEEGLIDFDKSPEVIERLIRGVQPWPGAYTTLDGETFKIWAAEVTDKKTDKPGGTVVETTAKYIDVAAGGGVLRLTEVQAPGKKRMSAGDYLRGNRLETGKRLGE
ncbi:MAG: methionyl-tRNA formyltransferase [Firmicutes bacterium]|nr:methionyl-tRNA formyltransferase [Bacillota bacterium]